MGNRHRTAIFSATIIGERGTSVAVKQGGFKQGGFPMRLLLFSVRRCFGLRAKDARAEKPLVNSGMQQNAETACVLGCVLKTQRFNDAFWPV